MEMSGEEIEQMRRQVQSRDGELKQLRAQVSLCPLRPLAPSPGPIAQC